LHIIGISKDESLTSSPAHSIFSERSFKSTSSALSAVGNAVFCAGEVLARVDKGEHVGGKEELSAAQAKEESAAEPKRARPHIRGQGKTGDPEEFQRKQHDHVMAVDGKARQGEQQTEAPQGGVLREGGGGAAPNPQCAPVRTLTAQLHGSAKQ